MAKDGTKRGGARPGAGRKKKPLVEKIQEGRDAVVMDTDGLESKEMPDVKEYLKADQAMGELHAAETYEEVWNWLKDRGCAELVSLQLIEQYSMSVAKRMFLTLRLQVSSQRVPAPYIADRSTLSRLPISVWSLGIARSICTSSRVKVDFTFRCAFFCGILLSVFLRKAASRQIFLAYFEKEFNAASLWFLVLALQFLLSCSQSRKPVMVS